MPDTFRCETVIDAASSAAVFDLCLDVDLHVQSMARSHERVVDAPAGGHLGAGDRVTWAARHFGVPWRMTSEVTEWDRPRRFVDEQVKGPFRSFRHEHLFYAAGQGVVMVDLVTLAAPLGLLGRAVERLGLGRYMQRLLHRRGQVIKAAAEGRWSDRR